MPTKTDLPVKNKKDVSFEVERIIGSRKYKGKQQYLIKWLGLGSDDNNWVDYDLMNCDELVNEFEERKKKKQEKLKKSDEDDIEIVKDSKQMNKDNKQMNKQSQKSGLAKEDKKIDSPKKGSLSQKDNKISQSSYKKTKIEPLTSNRKHKSPVKEKIDQETPKSKSDRINKLSPRKQRDFTKSVEDSEAMNKNNVLNGTLSNIQKKYNLPPNRYIPNTYDCIVDKVEGIITKNQRKLVQVLFIDGTRKEINLEIAKIGLPIHLINYYESKN